jgi:outer membrane protein assembly factor BamA
MVSKTIVRRARFGGHADFVLSGAWHPGGCAGGARIVVEGNQRVEADTVLAYMQVAPGEQMTPFNINESIVTLFQTGLFSDVQITRRNNTLVVRSKKTRSSIG